VNESPCATNIGIYSNSKHLFTGLLPLPYVISDPYEPSSCSSLADSLIVSARLLSLANLTKKVKISNVSADFQRWHFFIAILELHGFQRDYCNGVRSGLTKSLLHTPKLALNMAAHNVFKARQLRSISLVLSLLSG